MQIKLKTFLLIVSPLLLTVATAYVQWGTVGLPALPTSPTMTPQTTVEPYGFPTWLRITHYVNFLFIVLLVRSGLQILADHPRLYWNVHCTPGTEWLRLTPVEVPKDRLWTAKDDSRYLSPWIGLPGYRHTIGMARHWHFLSVLFWVGNGVVFVVLLFATDQWKRLVPNSWQIVPDAWAVFVHYATFHLPPEPNGFYHYNALQQLAYFGVVFILAPLAILTGPVDVAGADEPVQVVSETARQPADRPVASFPRHVRLRHLPRRPRDHGGYHRVRPEHEPHRHRHRRQPAMTGLYLGLLGMGVIVAVNVLANWLAWRTAADRPARRQGNRYSGHAVLPRPSRAGRRVSPRGHLPVPLGQRQGAHLRGMEGAGGRQLQGLPAEGVRPGGEAGRVVAGRPAGAGQEGTRSRCTTASKVGRASPSGAGCRWRTDSTGPADDPMQKRSSFIRLAMASRFTRASRAFSITTISRSRTL